MADLENISAEDLRQLLAEVGDADATQRLMAAITYKEIDGLTQNEAADLYGFFGGWASKWFNRLERLEEERSRTSSAMNLGPDDRPNSPHKNTSDSWMHSANRGRKPVLMRPRGLSH